MKPRILLLALFVAGGQSLRAEFDTGRPTSGTPYCRYIGSVRQVLSRSGGAPSIDEVRSQLRTARRFRYYFNPAQPYVPQAPEVTEARREGDCKAKSLWLANKMSASGVRYVIGKAKPGDRQSHAWLLWSNAGTWLFLVPTMESDVLYADRVSECAPRKDAAFLAEIAALLKDEDQPVRSAAARTLGAAGPAAKPHLLGVIRFFNDDPAVPPYGAAEAVAQISPLTPQELTSLLYPLYVYADLQPLVRLTAYGASGGEPDGLLIVRLLGRSRAAAQDVVKKADKARVTALLQDAAKAPLLHQKLKTEITSRLAEIKAVN